MCSIMLIRCLTPRALKPVLKNIFESRSSFLNRFSKIRLMMEIVRNSRKSLHCQHNYQNVRECNTSSFILLHTLLSLTLSSILQLILCSYTHTQAVVVFSFCFLPPTLHVLFCCISFFIYLSYCKAHAL
jgi:hypothetical protein